MAFNPHQPRGADGRWIRLATLLRQVGGFTHSLSEDRERADGFALAVKGYEAKYPGLANADDVKRFAAKHADILKGHGFHLGGWYDTESDQTFLDISEVMDDGDEALRVARERKELAIFDLGSGKEIRTGIRKKDTDMSTVITPVYSGGDYDFAKSADGKLAFWKQILPKKRVHFTAKDGTRRQLDFNDEFLADLAKNKAVDQLPFLLADADNKHTMDPEKFRGEVVELAVRDDGLYGKIVFPNADAAKAVVDNPKLGVSARIRPNVERSDGSTIGRGLIHVLGTLDPQISGMSGWQTADLSNEDEVIDLSEESYEDMAEQTKTKISDYTEADIDAMTEEELDKFLAEFVPELDAYNGSTEEPKAEDKSDEDETGKAPEDKAPEGEKTKEPALAGAGADMSKTEDADIELANEAVAAANARANEAMRRVAEAEWKEERAALIDAGVPPAAIDLAAPVLNRADDMVIDLSNSDEDDVNVSQVVRDLLGELKGVVDLSKEQGHNGTFTEGEDPDAELLSAWDKQF